MCSIAFKALALATLLLSAGACDPWFSDEDGPEHSVALEVPSLKVEGGGHSVGEQGLVSFITSQCGLYSAPCSLSKAIVVDTAVHLWLDSHPTDAVTIEVEDPSILALDKAPSSEGLGLRARGVAPGETRLLAVTSAGEPVDWIEVRVVDSGGLAIAPLDERMVRVEDEGATQRWRVPSEEVIVLYLVPEVDDYLGVMGEIELELIDVSEDLLASMVELGGTHIALGTAAFLLPVVDLPLIVHSPDGLWSIRALLEARPMAPAGEE